MSSWGRRLTRLCGARLAKARQAQHLGTSPVLSSPPHQSLHGDQQLTATHLHTPKRSPIRRFWLCASQAVAKPPLTLKSSTTSLHKGRRLLRLHSLPEAGAIRGCHNHQAVGACQEQGTQRLKMSRLHTPRYSRKRAHPQLTSTPLLF